MGGGPEIPAHGAIQVEDEDVIPLNSRVNDLAIKVEDEADTHGKVIINIDDSDDEKEGVLDGEDTDGEMDEPVHKELLMRELKALGIDPKARPDYTKPLDEPSWGDSDDEEGEDMEIDGDGVLDGEDEDEDDDEDAAMDEGELAQLRS